MEIIEGRIAYLSGRTSSDGAPWGHESFAVTREADGSRSLRVWCELSLGNHVIRDVTQANRADFYPKEAFVRLIVDGRHIGSGWFWFEGDGARCEGWSEERGRFSDSIRGIDPQMRGFGTHALQGDAWLAARFGVENGPGVRMYQGNLLYSVHHLGADGPGFARTDSGIEYLGDEFVSVPAGRFETHHFRLIGSSTDHPDYDFWTSTDGNFLFIKGALGGAWASRFELESLSRRPAMEPVVDMVF